MNRLREEVKRISNDARGIKLLQMKRTVQESRNSLRLKKKILQSILLMI